jgi:hypothetical protein
MTCQESTDSEEVLVTESLLHTNVAGNVVISGVDM